VLLATNSTTSQGSAFLKAAPTYLTSSSSLEAVDACLFFFFQAFFPFKILFLLALFPQSLAVCPGLPQVKYKPFSLRRLRSSKERFP